MSQKYYYPELDGLRFLAFLAVFIHHGPLLTWIPGYVTFVAYGWIGVDLFLCLSAFLFVHLLRMEWERTGTINVGFFYLRRSLRIWPIYFIYVTIVVWATLAQVKVTDLYLLHAYGLLTFTDNLLSAGGSLNPILYTGHLWTISYEEQFYAAIPWFLRAVFKQTRQQQFRILGGVLLAGMAIRALFIALNVPHPAVWVLPITHFESILFGLAIGLGVFDELFRRVPAWALALAGLLSLYLCSRLPNVNGISWSLMLLYPLVGLAVSLLIYATLRAQRSKVTAWLRWGPMTFLGKISYGLYLFHIFSLVMANQWMNQIFAGKSPAKVGSLVFIIGIVMTVAIGTASYLLIEKPFLHMKSRFTIVQSRPV